MSTDWRTVQLGDVLSLDDSPAVPTPREDLVPLAGVKWYGEGFREASVTAGKDIKTAALFRVRPGAFIYNRMWVTKGTFALVPTWAAGMYATNEYPQFIIDESRLLPDYLVLLSKHRDFLGQVDAAAVGSTERRRLHPAAFLELEVDLPSLEEQRRVIEAVRRVTVAAVAHERCSSASRTALRSAREELLLTEDGWEDLPDDWQLQDLGQISEVRSGITKGRKTRGELTEVPFIRAANVQPEHIDLTEVKTFAVTPDEADRFALKGGDILLVEGSGTPSRLGSGWIWQAEIGGPVVFQNHVFRVRCDVSQVLPEFVAHALMASPARTYFLESAKTTSGLSTINRSQVAATPIPVPPQQVQHDIVAQLNVLRQAAFNERSVAARLRTLERAVGEEFVSGARKPPALLPCSG